MGEFPYGHLKLRHLKLLSLLEELGSITRAARQLHLTQPAVSAMLRELEALFGVRLVERSRRGVTLTPAAHVALRRFRIALSEIDASHGEAVRAERQARSRIRVGALTVTMLDLVPQALARFIARFDAVQVEIVEGTADDLSAQLLRGELDLVVGRIGLSRARSPEGAQLDQVRLFDEPRSIACRAGHPLARLRSPTLERLAAEGWVLQPVPSSSRQAFDELFLSRGMLPPTPRVESASAHSCLEVVARTDLLAVSPRALARRQVESGRVHLIEGASALAGMAISAIWRRSGASDPILAGFRDALIAGVGGVGGKRRGAGALRTPGRRR
jgi:molybdate transport repressor ModE-like protein